MGGVSGMGKWVVIAEYRSGDYDESEIFGVGSTKDQALEALRGLTRTYLPRPGIIEQWRQTYRLADHESYVVMIKGKMSLWHCTLRVAELVADSADPALAKAVQAEDAAAEAAAAPRDRIPPGYR
ncbi:hypothetical protein [Streptomyces sp. V4I2]|uniref:hypothetical protein n=1 Tax=Streptomyces sp. V4I2 TaxID=3042280 RepID=UPI0027888873|nr:hypothetical protein [Streptomyces sp. V4I2]MDQ1046704.1 hypothetical protein [Streptomyces sp. V4I2]